MNQPIITLLYLIGIIFSGTALAQTQAAAAATSSALPQQLSLPTAAHYQRFFLPVYFIDSQNHRSAPRIISAQRPSLLYRSGDLVYTDTLPHAGSYWIYRPLSAHARSRHTAIRIIGKARTQLHNGTHAPVLQITHSSSEISAGDYLLPANDDSTQRSDTPPLHLPEREINAGISQIINGMSESGTQQTLLLDQGSRHGLNPGTLLGIYQSAPHRHNTPPHLLGHAVVYRSSPDAAFALIIHSHANINRSHRLSHPGLYATAP